MRKMISKFVREQQRYTKNDLRRIFNLKSDEIDIFIKNLKSFGVLKAVKNSYDQKELSDLIDADIEITDTDADNDAYLYVFTYVGVITVGSRIIKCFPKYILKADEPHEELKQVLKVIKKYGAKEQIVNLYNGDGDNKCFNLLAVILFLFNDYHEYGIYNNIEDIIEINGEGEILWDKTINESFALISNNRPYYMELYTEKTVNDECDFFKRLHECILTYCSKQLENCGLTDLFDLLPIELCDETIEDFGDKDYILYRLQCELNIQFNTRKQILLKTLYAYMAQDRTLEDSYGISMYGTNSFNLVWENVCSEVFNNKLYTPIRELKLLGGLVDGYKPNIRLIDIIYKPLWVGFDDENNAFIKKAKNTLKPDLISIIRKNENVQFIIFDAKYYNIQLDKTKKLRSYPGVGDVTKQYLYQLAYQEFLDKHKINEVRNCFLMPSQGDKIIKKGFVKMQMLKGLGLKDIQNRLLPANMIYQKYLTGKIIDIDILEL